MPYQAPQRSLQGLSGSGEADFHARARLRPDSELRPGSARAVFGRTAGRGAKKGTAFSGSEEVVPVFGRENCSRV